MRAPHIAPRVDTLVQYVFMGFRSPVQGCKSADPYRDRNPAIAGRAVGQNALLQRLDGAGLDLVRILRMVWCIRELLRV